MPLGTNQLELAGFYSGIDALKSIQKPWRFLVSFYDAPGAYVDPQNPELAKKYRAMLNEIGPQPSIKQWHVKNITIPQYKFHAEAQKYGPLTKSFPVMDTEPLRVNVTMDEDEQGTIAYFINWMQRRIIDKNNGGVHRSQKLNRITDLIIETEDDSGVPIQIYWFKNIFLTEVSETTFDYSSNENISYTLGFAVDWMRILPIKALAEAKLIEAFRASSGIGGINTLLVGLASALGG